MSWIDVLNRGSRRLDVENNTIDLLHWAYSPHLPDNVPHRHTFFEVCLMGQYGNGVFTVQGQTHQIAPGDIFFARPGVIHQIQNSQKPGMELFWVSFMVAPLREPEAECSLSTAFSASSILIARDEENTVTSVWNTLRIAANQGAKDGNSILLKNLMSALVISLMQAGTPHEQQRTIEDSDDRSQHMETALVRMALRYIHDNLDRRLYIQEVANHVHISPRHLSRLMSKLVGTSPAAYIERARMDRARALLHDGQMAIKKVAIEVGYEDVHHFTRVFTRTFGVSPGVLRNADTPLSHDAAQTIKASFR